jgi:GNAT superfamily N-acetyltransferase
MLRFAGRWENGRVDHAAVLAGYRSRLRDLDPLLPAPDPLPDPDGDAVILSTPGAVGLARRILVDPDELAATWGAPDQRWLTAHAVDPPALAGLLTAWGEHLADRGPDSIATVQWPSRDLRMTPVFLAHGLVPSSVIAVRPAWRQIATTSTTARIRTATPADLDAVVALRLAEVRFAAQLGDTHERPGTEPAMRASDAAALASDHPLTWLAEIDGVPAGMVSLTPGERMPWVATRVDASPVAYLDCASIAPAHRGAGLGSALIARVHDECDQAGIAATVLHYDALNPISAPFWHRNGYRPLWTRWQSPH